MNRLGVIGLGLVFGRVTFDLWHLALQLKGIARGSEVVLRYSLFWSLSAEKLRIHLPEPTKRSIFALSRPWGPVTSRTASQHSLVTANPKNSSPKKHGGLVHMKTILCVYGLYRRKYKLIHSTDILFYIIMLKLRWCRCERQKKIYHFSRNIGYFLLFLEKQWIFSCRFPEKKTTEKIFFLPFTHAPSDKTKECKEINNIHWKLYMIQIRH